MSGAGWTSSEQFAPQQILEDISISSISAPASDPDSTNANSTYVTPSARSRSSAADDSDYENGLTVLILFDNLSAGM